MEKRKDILVKAYVIYFAICLFGLFIIGKIFVIQFVEAEKWHKKVERITTDLREIQATRGNIYAADGSILATSIPIYEVRMDLMADGLDNSLFYEKVDSLSQSLANLFEDRTALEYRNLLIQAKKAEKRYQLVKRNVDYNQLQVVNEFPLFRLGRFKSGVIYEKQTVRQRPFQSLAARTIGYDREGVQPVGLEGAYNTELRGRPGSRYEKRLAGGIWMPIKDDNEVEPLDGSDIYTTIDPNIQDVANSALLDQLILHDAHHGTAVLMEVKTGYVKAIANLTLGDDGLYREDYNYAIGEATEPGSTFKLASFMAALEDGKFNLDDSVDTENGKYRFYDRIMRDTHEGGYGVIDVKTAFQKSSNVAVSRLINEHYSANPQQFIDRLHTMGLGRPLGLSISGEGSPKIRDPHSKSWSGVSLPWMSIGYETLLTPMQILAFYNAVANDGEMLKPLFVSDIRRGGELINHFDKVVLNSSIASKETIAMAREMLESVVSKEGTASNLVNANYSIAGKTGTAQIANKQYGYKYEQAVSYQASFVGYFPAENPRYSCIVVVNGPSNNVYYGNQVAGPIFKEIADKVYAQSFDLHQINPETSTEVAINVPVSMGGNSEDLLTVFENLHIALDDDSKGDEWVSTTSLSDTVRIDSRNIQDGLIPNVMGMGLQDALFLLENRGLQVRVNGVGVVKRQSVIPGARLSNHSIITLELS